MSKAAQNSTPQLWARAAPKMRAALRAWYLRHRRPLPWRAQPSLYKTVVSEFMLQQTQVETVLPYFARWLKKFPDFKTLAAARERDVLRLWEGLGYYRRARLLHALAREIAPLPSPPRTPAAWLALPGVGPYTAAAITSISFGEPAAVVDGNVVRVLARLLGDDTLFKDGTSAVKTFQTPANILLNTTHPGDHNQAVMELGATVCTKHKPHCPICPLKRWCAAAKDGNPESLPRFAAKTTTRINLTRLWIERNGTLLLHRRPASSRRLANVCELPEASILPDAIITLQPLAIKRRTITTQLFIESIHRTTLPPSAPVLSKEFVWANATMLKRLTLSGPHRRWIAELRENLVRSSLGLFTGGLPNGGQ